MKPPTKSDTGVRRLVNAVLVPGFVGTSVPGWLEAEFEQGLGGVCWFAQNVPDASTARALADQVHSIGTNALIWCDEEGGAVTRLHASEGSPWPGHAALGHLDDLAATRSVATGIGADARAAGIDIALAPVVDVNSDPDNPVIGVRSFGATPDAVSRHATAFIDGLQSAGVAACAKHYPGHGATRVDSHLGLPVVDADLDVLWARELAPFVAAVEAGVRCVLTAHVVFPAVDALPATISESWIRLLRQELGFDGVIGTDALDMRAISDGVGRGEGAVAALRAGIDAVCIGNPIFPQEYDSAAVLDDVRTTILTAIEYGRLDIERVEQAVARLADLAAWTEGRRDEPMSSVEQVGADVARRTLLVEGDVALSNDPLILMHQAGNIAAGDARFPLARSIAEQRPGAKQVEVCSVADARKALQAHPGLTPVVVTDGFNGTQVVDVIRQTEPTAVVVHTGAPGTGGDLAGPLVRTWGGGAATAGAVAELLVPHGAPGGSW